MKEVYGMGDTPGGGIVLTGDRPTGPLHIGHYVGSLSTRLAMQGSLGTEGGFDRLLFLIADMQALTDNAHNVMKVRENVLEVALDYLAVGIDPDKSTMFIQSTVPELAELTMYYLNFVTLARLRRNPTVKDEMDQKGYGETVPAGFLTYPVSQASDITAFRANAVPVGIDQMPMIEQTNEIVRHINGHFGKEVLTECRGVLSKVASLPGTDGKAKMAKSMNNTINLKDGPKEIDAKVMGMYTDPGHIRVEDPGRVEGNAVFRYLDAFDPDAEGLERLKEHYRAGGLGDVKVKRRLQAILHDLLTPIRARREEYAKDPGYVMECLKKGGETARGMASATLGDLKEVFMQNFW